MLIRIGSFVSRRRDEKNSGPTSFVNRVSLFLRKLSAAAAVVDYFRAHFNGVVNRIDRIFQIVSAGDFGIKIFKNHQADLRRNPGDSFIIARLRTNDAGDMSSVTVVIREIIVVGNEIPTMNVIDKAVPVVINSVGRFVAAF